MTFLKKCVTGLWVISFCLSGAASYAAGTDAPIQIHGDLVEYFQNEQKAVGTGHVVIDYDGDRLTADKITVYMDKKLAVAEGSVVLTQKGGVYKGPRGEYDFGRKSGNISEMSAVIPGGVTPYYGKARKVERVSENHYRTTDGYITTCCSENPFYKLQAQQVDVYPDDRIEVRNALLVIKGVPILFIPYYVQHYYEMRHLPVQLIPGKSDEYGPFLLSKWRYELYNSPEFKSRGNVLVDYRDKRGMAYGVENFYRGPAVGRGSFKYYTTRDSNSPLPDDPDRNRVQLRHQMRLTPNTAMTLEVNKLSDIQMIKDFFYREEYERDTQPDNYISIITATPDYSLSFLERRRLDDFFTVVEKNPEVHFDTYNKQFAETPFYLREDILLSDLQKRNASSDYEYDTFRGDNNFTLSYAGHVRNFAVTPRVGTRQTFYGRDAYDTGTVTRGTFDPGLDISTHFYKVYDTYIHSWGLDYNQLRHIFTPTVSYNFRPNPTVGRNHLLQFDQIDTLDKQNYIRFNFENQIQTKEHIGPKNDGPLNSREIARITPFFDMDYTTDRLENIGYSVELRPYTWMGVIADGTYSSRLRAFETVNTDFYTRINRLTLSLGQRYVRRDSSLAVLSADLEVNKDWAVGLYQSHEFKKANDTPSDTGLTITRKFECVTVDMILNWGREDSIYFVLHIKGFPETPVNLVQKTYGRQKLTGTSSARLNLAEAAPAPTV